MASTRTQVYVVIELGSMPGAVNSVWTDYEKAHEHAAASGGIVVVSNLHD